MCFMKHYSKLVSLIFEKQVLDQWPVPKLSVRGGMQHAPQLYKTQEGLTENGGTTGTSPLSAQKRENWKKAEAQKRKHIIQAKRAAWRSHLLNLDSREDPAKLWNFVKAMLGKKVGCNPLDKAAIKDSDGHRCQNAQDKANLFLEIFSKNFATNIPNNKFYESAINSSVNSTSPNALNAVITQVEIDQSMKKLKNTSIGIDLIHNKMLRNLSPINRIYLCHLFNILLKNVFVPVQWKKAIVAPLLKPGKPEDDPVSYRPVSLTSCLCKLFERVIAGRLDWFVESKRILHNSQAGFGRGRNTSDHIIQLEMDVKESFASKKSTVAVFLDISKAYDCVWIQGLLFKLSRIGVSGLILGWISRFLTDRELCVRVGSYLSEFRPILTGVPQGAVLSPLLFNIMLYDFPIPPSLIKKLLYADDITIYVSVKKYYNRL